MTQMRIRALDDLKTGDRFSVTRKLTESEMTQFGHISSDYNPVHYDERFARASGFPSCICHGLLVGSLCTEIGGQLALLATHMDFQFIKPVFFGDTVTCTLTITSISQKRRITGQMVFTNQNCDVVIKGTLSGISPNVEGKAVLKAMIEEGDPTNLLSQETKSPKK